MLHHTESDSSKGKQRGPSESSANIPPGSSPNSSQPSGMSNQSGPRTSTSQPTGDNNPGGGSGVTIQSSGGGATGGHSATVTSTPSSSFRVAPGGISANANPMQFYDNAESVLPREFRSRLHKLFIHIEREFEREYRKLYAENIALQERLEKYEDGDHAETNFLAKKLGASQISQKIKLQYKQSTSRLVSSLRPQSQAATGGWQLGCRMSGHRDGIWEVTAYKKLVGSASADGTVRLWSNSSGSCLLFYNGHSGSVNSVRFKDDFMLTASGDGTAHLVRIPSEVFSLSGMPSTSAATPHGNQTVSGSIATNPSFTANSESWGGQGVDVSGGGGGGGGGSGGVVPSSTSSTSMVPTGGAANGESVEEFHKSADVDTYPEDSMIVLRHPQSVFENLPHSHSQSVTLQHESSALSAADFLGTDQIVTGSWDRLGRIYDLNTGQVVDTLTGHDHQLTDVRTPPLAGQKLVLTSAKDSTFRLWDFRKSAPQVHVQQGHSQTVSTAQFLDDSADKIVSAGTDRVCKIWDLRQSRTPLVSIRTDASVNRLAVHPSGQILALPLDNRNVKFFDLQGQRLGRLPRSSSQGHSRMVTSVTWADEEKNNFFSSGFDNQVLGWQIQFPFSN